MELMVLTPDNYYSPEANKFYMSVSQFKSFVPEFGGCEAKAMAELNGTYERKMTDALLVGSYVDAWCEGTLENFKVQHVNDIYDSRALKKNEYILLKKFQEADEIIEIIKRDKILMLALTGEKQKIFTANFMGIPWKIKMDVYNPEAGYFTDMKIMAGFYDRFYNKELGIWENFIEHYHYNLQMYVYASIEKVVTGRKNYLEPYIGAISKETPCDKEVFKGFVSDFDSLQWVLDEKLPRVLDVKNGKEEPKACLRCDYCRSVKTANIVDYHYLLA
jgi:hypothetical protein